MITYKNGDLLESKCDIICHQVNLQGVFGGGLAYQIYCKFPNVEKNLQKALNKDYGQVVYKNRFDLQFCGLRSGLQDDKKPQYIANIFSQDEYFNTKYDWLDIALTNLIKHIEKIEGVLSIKTFGFPYGYGCGIANGEWKEVEKVLKKYFDGNTKYNCEIWKYEK